MSWKSVKKHYQNLSITLRLTILYSVSAFGILLLSSLIMYELLVKNLATNNSWFLKNQTQIIVELLQQKPDDLESLEEEIVWEPMTTQNHYYARVLDQHNNVILETTGMSDLFRHARFPYGTKITESGSRNLYQSVKGRYYLLNNVKIDGGKNYNVQVALDVTHEQIIIAQYRETLFYVLLCGIFLSAGLGIIVTRRGLQPLTEVTKAIREVSVSQLHERLRQKRWPQELTTLVNEFNSLLDRMEHAFTQLSQFSADLAHELRTPINNLMGETEICLSKSRSVAEYENVLHSNLEEYHKLASMIEKLLFLARAENPRTAISPVNLDLKQEFAALYDYHEAVADEQQVKLLCHGEGEIAADPILFRRAISNLLSNSLKYVQPGDEIYLRAEQTQPGYVITVRDTGPGIPKEHLNNLFNRFYRVDSARSKNSGGSGLGLAIVKSIVELHGGSVTANSQVGEFTEIVLKFP